jgi:hypothetical protein
MGSSGGCYLATFLDVSGTSEALRTALWQVAPGFTTMQRIVSLREYILTGSFSGDTFAYVPAAKGMSSRLVVFTWGYKHPWYAWNSLLSFWGREEQDNLLLWTPVP